MKLFIYILGDPHKHTRPLLHHHIPASQPQHQIVLVSDFRVLFLRHILALHSQHNWLSMLRHWQLFPKLFDTDTCLFFASIFSTCLFHLFRNADVDAILFAQSAISPNVVFQYQAHMPLHTN